MNINLENYIGKTVEVVLRNGDVWTGHKVKVDKLTFNQFKYLIGGGSDYYHKFGLHSYCNLYDIVKIRVLKPNIIPHGQEKKMLDEKGHIQCEIEEFKIEMQRHRDTIQNCIKLVKKNNEKLRKLKQMKEEVNKLQNNNWKIQMKNARYPMLEVIDENTVRIEGVKYQKVDEVKPLPKPQTLLEILLDWWVQDWTGDSETICEQLVDTIGNWMSKYECDYVVCAEYLQGYNAHMETLKANLK